VGLAVCAIVVLQVTVQADVVEFDDKAAWEAAVGDYTTIDFTGYEWGTLITDQYEDQGVLFTDCKCYINGETYQLYPNDGWGLKDLERIHIEFVEPQHWIAVEFPGSLKIELFFNGNSLYHSAYLGGGGSGFFGGLVSDQLFDEVVIYDPQGTVTIDDLHFGVPTPGSVIVLLVGITMSSQRRR
jgi:hypothetical protein